MTLRVKVKEVDNSAERLMCIGIIMSDRVISQLAPILDTDVFTAKYTQAIASWCMEYFREFEKAPKTHIQDIFEAKKRDFLDDDIADLIETLLISLNDQMMDQDRLNEDYVLEEAEKYIKRRKAKMLCEDVLALLSKGQELEAEGLIAQYNIPKRPSAEGEDIFDPGFFEEEDIEAVRLFRLKGELHSIVGWIERDSFIGILAPEKTGKTWLCMEMGLAAFRARCNVAFFAIGDMTKPQMRRRFKHMLTGRDPRRTDDSKILVPILDCRHNQRDDCPLGEDTDSIMLGKGELAHPGTYEDFPDHEVCTLCYKSERDKRHFHGVPWYRATTAKAEQKPLDKAINDIKKRSFNRRFRLFCFPPNSVNISMIKNHLDILQQQEDFLPDVIIIDYADNLLPEQRAARLDYRNQINDTWQEMRKLSQERNCALITATQAKGQARLKTQVGQDDVSEDKRKLAHVTAMLALNKTPEDKRNQIMRITNIATRDMEFDVEKNVAVLQCLAIGKPILFAYTYKEEPKKTSKKKGEK